MQKRGQGSNPSETLPGLVGEGENMELPSGENIAPPASGDIIPGDMKAAQHRQHTSQHASQTGAARSRRAQQPDMGILPAMVA